MDILQRITKNTLSLFTGSLIGAFFTFIAMAYIAKTLGPDTFGRIAFALAIVTYFSVFNNSGLPLLGTRQVARHPEKINNLVGSILVVRLWLTVLGLSLLICLIFLLNESHATKYLMLLYGMGMIPSAILLDWVFQSVEKMGYVGIARAVAAAVFLGLIRCFVITSDHVLFVPCMYVTSNLLVAGLLFWAFVKHFGWPNFRIRIASIKSLMRKAIPIGGAILISPAILYTDTIMLGFMSTDAEVGYYNAACKIVAMLVMLSVLYQDSVFPIVSSVYKTSLDDLRKVQSYSAKILMMTSLPLTVGVIILAKPIIYLLYGADYTQSIRILQILIFFFALEHTYSVFARGLLACNRETVRLKIISILALSNIILNSILIPSFGMEGAAIATVFVRIIGFALFRNRFNKIVIIPIHTYIYRPLISSVIMGLFLFIVSNSYNVNVMLSALTGGILYMLILYVLRGISFHELSLIRRTIVIRESIGEAKKRLR